MVTVAPVTSRIRGIRSEVALGPNEGLPRPCAVNLDSITTINRQELRDLITLLDRPKMREVDAAIQFALGLDEGL
jgi:mRNA interferase MazF